MKKLLSVLLALCLVFSMVTVAAVSVGAAETGADAATGASARTIYVGVITYLNLNTSNYQVHYWGGSDGAKDVTLTATGKTAQQAVGSSYWNNQPQTFNMYTASIPADATGYKVHNGNTWFGSTDGNTANNNTAYVFEYGGNYNAFYTTTQEQEEPTQPATDDTEPSTDAPAQRPYTMYVDLTDVLSEGGSNWYAWTWDDGKDGEWVNIEKFGYVSVYKNVLFASFNVTPPDWSNVVSQTVDTVVEDGNTLYVLSEKENGKFKVKWKTEPTTDEPTQPATDNTEPATEADTTAAADTITVKFTDAMFYGDVNVYYWPNGGDWPGKAMTEVEENDYSQKVYTAEIPADVDGIIFNGNGRQTVDITEGIADGAWWYTVEETDDAGHNYVKLVGNEEPTDEPTEPATDEPTQPATDDTEPATEADTTAAADTITVKFTDAEFYGDVNVYYWPNGGDWPGKAMTEVEENDYGQKVYTAEIPADVDGIIFNGNGRQTVDITEGIADGAWWYTVEETDDAGHNYVKLVGNEEPTDEPTEPATDEPTQPATDDTEPATNAPVTEIELDGDYFLVGYINGADYSGSDYKFEDGKLTATFAETSYVCIKDAEGNWYMTKGFDAEATEVTLYSTDITGEDSDKMLVPAGKADFTLKAYSDGTFKLSYVTEEITTDEPGSEPATEDDTTATDTITVKFTDAMFYGDVNVYYWPNGGDWPGKAMTEVEENDYSQKVYTAEIPADVDGIIFNGNGRQTVDITEGIADGAWWYTVEETDDAGHNYVKLVGNVEPTDEPSQPATDEPATDEPATADPSAKGAYYIVGNMNNWTASDDYKLTKNEAATENDEYMITGLALTKESQFKVVYTNGDAATAVWFPGGDAGNYGANGEITADGTYTVYFRPNYDGFDDWFNKCIVAIADEPATDEPSQPATDDTQPATDDTQPASADPTAKGGYFVVGTMTSWKTNTDYKLTKNEASAVEEYMIEGLALTTTDEFKVVYSSDGTDLTTWFPDGTGNNYGENGEIKADGTYTVYFRPNYDGNEGWFYNTFIVIADEPATDEPTEPATDDTEPATDQPATDAVEVDLADGFALVGYIDGADYSGTDYAFVNGQLTMTFAEASYVCIRNADGKWFMTNGFDAEAKEVTLYDTDITQENSDKMMVPAGKATFTLKAYSDGTYKLSYVTEEITTDEPGTDEPDETTEPVVGEGAYYIVGTMNNWEPAAEYKLTENEAAEGEYMFTGLELTTTDEFKVVYYNASILDGGKIWYPDGTGNNYGENGEITADGTYDVYFRPDGQGGEDWFYGVMYVAAQEQPTEPATDEPTEPIETTEPVVGAGAYYIVGTMNDWEPAAEYKLTENEAAEGEYMFTGLELTTTDEFKVVYYNASILDGGKIWYPDGTGNNYGENGEITADGTYDVYFRPDGQGGEDWFYGVMYVAAQEQPTEPATDEPTEPIETTEPVVGEGAYYIVGTMNNWEPAAEYKLTENEAAEGEYMFTGLELTTTDEFKVVYYNASILDGGKIWYPDGTGNNYGENGEITADGTYDVYFRPDGQGGEDWFYGVMYVAAQEQPTEPATDEPTEPATDEPTEPVTDAPVTEIELDGDYFLVGYIDGADYSGSDYKFTDGTLTATFADTSYVCIKNADGKWFMTNGFDAEATEVTLYDTDITQENSDKMLVPAGKATFTLKAYSDGTFKLSYVTEEITTDEPGTDAPAEGGYYIVGTMNDWTPADEYKLTENEAAEGEYMFLGLELTKTSEFKVMYQPPAGDDGVVWYPDGTGNNYGENGEITADGTYDVYFRPDGQGGEDWFYGVMYVAAQEQPTEPATDEPTEPTEPIETTEPVVGAGAYYIVGTMNDWEPAAEYKLTENEAAEGEYMFTGLELTTTDEFKVVYYNASILDGGKIWYPDGTGNNYGENGEITADGTYDVYFRPDGQGGEDWFYGVMYVAAQEQPTEPATDEPTEPSEPVTDEPSEPSEPVTDEPGEEATYVVAGSPADIFGTAWDGVNEDNLMAKGDDGKYTKDYTVDKAFSAVQLKVVKNGSEWIGDNTGNNVTFDLTGAGTFTVTIDPETNEITVTGDIVQFITEFEYDTVFAVGNGEGWWLNGAAWDPAFASNEMTEVADDVWEIEFQHVPDGFERQIKFAIDGAWTHNFGGAYDEELDGEPQDAVYNGDNITFDTYDDAQTIKVQLDLRDFDFTTKEGAKYTITIVAEGEETIIGDVNGDGEVTIEDATMIQRYLAEFIDLTDEQLAAADVNGDDDVDIRDVTQIQRYVAEFITAF